MAAENKQCRIEGCYRAVNRRGLCLICYGKAKAKVEKGETTWEKLVERGLCEAERDPFDDAYSRAMEDN